MSIWVQILLWILGGLAGLLFLVLVIPFFIRLTYDGQLQTQLWIWGIPIRLYPRPAKKKNTRKKRKPLFRKRQKPQGPAQATEKKLSLFAEVMQEDGIAGLLAYLSEMALLGKTAAGRALAALTIDRLRVEIAVGGPEADEIALRYGKICAGIYPAVGALGCAVKIRRPEIRVEPCFSREESAVFLDIRLHGYIFRLVWAALGFFVGYLGNTIRDKTKQEVA